MKINYKLLLKLIQSIFCVVIITIIGFSEFSSIIKYLLIALFGFIVKVDILLKYVDEWTKKKYIANKSELVKDIIHILVFCCILVIITLIVKQL